ncbi:MAG: TonB-dependent receptor [Pirellulaceae bacterium]|nr:TonB-dependent receptor [Pirellulaceae bacterium]
MFGSANYEINDCWSLGGAVGVGMRPPTLTELYATGPFLSVIQNGFNSVIGDPNLDAARHTQVDLNLRVDTGRFRGGLSGFFASVKDYITYEVALFGALPEENTRGLTYVNTPRATLAGGEAYAEYDVNDWLTPFVTASYVEGRDQTRSAGGMQFYNPAVATFFYDPNAPRGLLPGSDEEPLPSISPFEARAGFWIRERVDNPTWGVEFSARIVDSQDRVATSIGELPTAGFTVYDIRGYWQATQHMTVVAGVENLTDKFYREHLDLRTGRGVFQPGIAFYSGAQVDW